jgi:AcrR family transcriptional regulator
VDRISVTAFEDLTARARIRQAALAQFTEHGYERTTIRGIAAAAGVSPGLVRHHFGSKQELRDAVDAHVLAEILRVNDEVRKNSEHGDIAPATMSRDAMRPYQGYLIRAMTEGSPSAVKIFDTMVGPTEEWLALADHRRDDPPIGDLRTRAAVLVAMALGVSLLHEHISRAVGVDVLSPDGDRQLVLALLDLYSHALVTPELAASARAAFDDTLRSTQ